MSTRNRKKHRLKAQKKRAAKRAYQRLTKKRKKQLELMEAMGVPTDRFREEWNIPDTRLVMVPLHERWYEKVKPS